MKKRIFAVLLSMLLIFSLLPTTNVFATIYIDEDVTISDYDSNNTYYLTDDMVIEEGVTLTFDSNIYYFDLDGYTLSNYGKIDAGHVRLYAYSGAFYNYGVYDFDEIFQYFTVFDLALSSIELSSGRVNLEAGKREYAVTVDYSVTSIDVTPTLNTGTGVAYMTVNGTTASSGAATTVSLRVGENTIRIVIKASGEGGTTNTYTLTVTRENNEDYIISNANFVSAGSFGITQDMLQWSDVDAPGGYKLEIYKESGTQVYSGTLENNYTPASEVLTASGTYYFTVYALDADGNELSYKTSDTFTYTHTHSLTYVEAKDATCTEDGNTEYWYCSGCGKYFSDSSAAAEISLSDTVVSSGHIYDTNGFCTVCGAYEPAELNADGVYEISSAGQLFWFAALVNGDTAQEGITAADTSAGAVLTTNIDLGTTTTTHTGTEWTPIGTDSAPYTGTFDGGGYEISGLNITTAADYAGLFGYVTGTVKNLTVSGDINVSGDTMCVGGIVGTVKNGTLSGLTSYVDVTGYDGTKGMFGGVAATAEGTNNTAGSTVERCAYYGTVEASGALTSVGGIVGYMSAATITDCINYGTVDSTGATSAGDTNIYTGGIVSYCNNANAVVANCVNVGTISGAGANTADPCYSGAIIGRIKDSVEKVSNCYYLTDADSTLDGIAANGSGESADASGKTAEEFASGEVVWLLQDANTEYVWGQELDADKYPVLITDGDSESGKKVVRIVFYKASDSTVLMKSYTNTGNTVADYPSGSEYTFYSDSGLTQEISDISTVTFSSDTDIYVETELQIITQPEDCTATVGSTAVFEVEAVGSGLTYQWQYLNAGASTWRDSGMSGADTAAISVPVTEARDGQQYRCVVTDGGGNTVTSDAATLTVTDDAGFSITLQPSDYTGLAGTTATFTVEADGTGLSYQWQYLSAGGTIWHDSGMAGSDTAALSVTMTEARDGQQYRCIVTDENGNSVISEAATLSLPPAGSIVITAQPSDSAGAAGDTATFTVEATGNGLTYQWQYLNAGASTWRDSGMTGADTATVSVPITDARDGQQYWCVITDEDGNMAVSDAVTLSVE